MARSVLYVKAEGVGGAGAQVGYGSLPVGVRLPLLGDVPPVVVLVNHVANLGENRIVLLNQTNIDSWNNLPGEILSAKNRTNFIIRIVL